ncbi:carbamoyltransferase [Bradyrhizobium sp. Pear77]|uniref:carbamoyltransferase family protein n=1 Tax=Bradyrhizobium altum TaxID=1571202 RepID=UPI001E41B1BC|nr:carbamoyltransferase C-terminal domain-containing protein [Bradyrhizobium altum]MCC8955504.1 carbamoyltransferase [Bradyrhizobium altum]
MAKVIGISGFESSIPFKRKHWPGLEEREYRISQGHDSAAVLVVDGRIVAGAAEERFNRKKHTGDFPIGAVSYCLETAGLKPSDIDAISHGFDYAPYKAAFMLDPTSARQYREVFSREKLLVQVDQHLPGFPACKVHHVNHHLSHAASAYYTSGWDECLVVVLDGMGEIHAVTVYHAHDNAIDKLAEITAQDSIGILYSTLTLHLGFDFNSDEYKIMGLAPYGDPARHRAFFERAVELRDDGLIRIPLLRLNTERRDRETYGATRRHLGEYLIPARAPDGDVTDNHRDVAAALQECLDSVMLHICGHFGRSTGLRRLAMAGGVALNCTANGRLLQSGLFDEIYVQPAAGDDGSALGAALWSASRDSGVQNVRMPVPFLGPAPTQTEIYRALADTVGRIEITRFPDLDETCAAAARLIAAGRVLGWYRGRMEFGPRALGHRSILADPGHPDMRDRINAMVKMREAFRPFAPAVSLEQVHEWFEVPKGLELPYMIMTADVRPEHRAALPAITHVNGSARVQTVGVRDNPEFHALLRAVGRATGREMVLNTSFNVKGQPIVNTPREAIDTFLGTGIEYLFLENVLVRRAGQM